MAVYKITNKANGKLYVGKTSKTIDERFAVHYHNAKKEKDTYLYKAMRKYGIENFTIELLDASSENMDDIEKYWIKELNTLIPNGYNMTTGGDGGDMSLSPNFLPSLKKRPAPPPSYGMKGKQHSTDTKTLQSKARKNHWDTLTEEDRSERASKVTGQKNGMFGKTPSNCVRIIYSGVLYASLAEAVKKTGRSAQYLKKYGELYHDEPRESTLVREISSA